jgi:hypothetical protein
MLLRVPAETGPVRSGALPLIEKVNGAFHVDEVFMLPIDFSAMK